jgi:hypothetical protein
MKKPLWLLIATKEVPAAVQPLDVSQKWTKSDVGRAGKELERVKEIKTDLINLGNGVYLHLFGAIIIIVNIDTITIIIVQINSKRKKIISL